jgi:hypothetical protein
MNRLVAVTVVGLLSAGVALADVPPPKGQKRVVADHKITTEKEIPDYTFFTVVGRDAVTAVKFDLKTPIVIKGAGRGGAARFGFLYAVPKSAAKQYAGEKEFHEAIRNNKVEGQVAAKGNFPALAVLKDADPRDTVVFEHTFEKIDGKEIVLKRKEDAAKKDGKEELPEEESGSPAAYTPRGGLWVAGLAAALAVTLGGLWLAGRGRRKV